MVAVEAVGRFFIVPEMVQFLRLHVVTVQSFGAGAHPYIFGFGIYILYVYQGDILVPPFDGEAGRQGVLFHIV